MHKLQCVQQQYKSHTRSSGAKKATSKEHSIYNSNYLS